jgi:Flp pilus assembly protein CpaB
VNTRRLIILIVAVFVAAVAAVGLLNYVQSAADTAVQEATPVPVWVVSQPIPKGTPIDQAINNGWITQVETTPNFKSSTAVEDPVTELAGLVAFTDLAVNTQVLTSTFVPQDLVDTGITERLLGRGLVTVTVSVGQTEGVANLIEPGDYVNVMVGRQWDSPFFELEDGAVPITESAAGDFNEFIVGQGGERPVVTDVYQEDFRMVYQKAEVLAVGKEIVPDLGQQDTSTVVDGDQQQQPSVTELGLITLAVPPESAQVILNVGLDAVYLSLVADDYEPRPILPLDPTTQVLPGERPDQLTPYDGVRTVDGQIEFGFDAVDVNSLPGPSGGGGTSGDETGDDQDTPDADAPVAETDGSTSSATDGQESS